MSNTVWHNSIDKNYLSSHEIIVKTYNHPYEGLLYGTLIDYTLVSLIGTNGPVDFQVHPDGDYFSVGNYVTGNHEDNFVKRGT